MTGPTGFIVWSLGLAGASVLVVTVMDLMFWRIPSKVPSQKLPKMRVHRGK